MACLRPASIKSVNKVNLYEFDGAKLGVGVYHLADDSLKRLSKLHCFVAGREMKCLVMRGRLVTCSLNDMVSDNAMRQGGWSTIIDGL